MASTPIQSPYRNSPGKWCWLRGELHTSRAPGQLCRTFQPARLSGPQTMGRPYRASSYLPFAEEERNRRSRKYRAPHSCHTLAESLASRFLKLKSNISPRRAVYIVRVYTPGLRKHCARLAYSSLRTLRVCSFVGGCLHPPCNGAVLNQVSLRRPADTDTGSSAAVPAITSPTGGFHGCIER